MNISGAVEKAEAIGQIIADPVWYMPAAFTLIGACYIGIFLAVLYLIMRRPEARGKLVFYWLGLLCLWSAGRHVTAGWDAPEAARTLQNVFLPVEAFLVTGLFIFVWKWMPEILRLPGPERLNEMLRKTQALVSEAAENRRRQQSMGDKEKELSAWMEDEIRVVSDTVSVLSRKEDAHMAVLAALEGVCKSFGWDYGEVWLPRMDGIVLESGPEWYAGCEGLEEFRLISQELRFPQEAGFEGRVWSSCQPEWVEDISGASAFRGAAAGKAGLRCAAAVPVMEGGELLAILAFFRRARISRCDRHLYLISLIALHLGSVIRYKRAEKALCDLRSRTENRVTEHTGGRQEEI